MAFRNNKNREETFHIQDNVAKALCDWSPIHLEDVNQRDRWKRSDIIRNQNKQFSICEQTFRAICTNFDGASVFTKVTKTITLNWFFNGYLVMLLSQENQGIQALFSQKNNKDGAFNKSIVQAVIWEEICPKLVWRVDSVNNFQLSFRYNQRPNFCLISIRHFTMGNLRNHQFQCNEQKQKRSRPNCHEGSWTKTM